MLLISEEKQKSMINKPHLFTPTTGKVVRKRILVVDDEDDTLRFLEKTLLMEGFDVTLAFDGLSALDLAKEERPDLILLDIMMPIMSGYEVLEKLHAEPETSNIPVIFISSAYTAEVIRMSRTMGAAGYIAKPFAPRELVDQIKRVLEMKE